MKIRLLLICSSYNSYVVQLWNNIKRYYDDVQTYLLTTKNAEKKYRQILNISDDQVFSSSGFIESISMGIVINRLPKFDVIQALWMEIPWGIFAKSLRKKTKVLYVEVGGSDLYRESKNKVLYQLQKRLIQQADIISSENKETKEIFKHTYGVIGDCKPHQIVRFGVDVIDEIDNIDSNISISGKWRIPQDKVVVMCGHNASPAHQHIRILDALQHLSDNTLQKLFLVFPMTYGLPSEEYRKKVEDGVQAITNQYRILDSYLTTIEMAEVARMTDIMIHVQDTDQLSSTMMAHMYDENIVIAGSWLPYGQIKEEGIRFWEVDNISELTGVLEEMIPNIDQYKEQCRGNREKVYRFSSWEYCIKDWYNVYETMLEKVEEK